MRGKVTIRHVAMRAGVAVGTVSHYLNRSAPVADGTGRRIQRTIDRLGYRPDLGARGLRVRRTLSVGLLLPNISNPFYSEVAREVEHALWEKGFQTLLCDSSGDPERERTHLDGLESRRVDGVLLIRSTGRAVPRAEPERRTGIPVVYVDRAVVGRHSVTSDNRMGGELAARHLAELGHRRFGVLAGEKAVVNVQQRLQGFRQEMDRHGLSMAQGAMVNGPQALELGYEVERLVRLDPRPTAIFATNDIVAIGAWRRLLELGFRIPQEISLVGFDDIEMSRLLFPPLTTVSQDKAAMGRQAAALLLRLMQGEDLPPAHTLVAPRLVVRGSTAPPPKEEQRS
jgi:LacI family transcriptional regulator